MFELQLHAQGSPSPRESQADNPDKRINPQTHEQAISDDSNHLPLSLNSCLLRNVKQSTDKLSSPSLAQFSELCEKHYFFFHATKWFVMQ